MLARTIGEILNAPLTGILSLPVLLAPYLNGAGKIKSMIVVESGNPTILRVDRITNVVSPFLISFVILPNSGFSPPLCWMLW